MSSPTRRALLKSKGVPATARSSPVGIRPLSTGVYLSANRCSVWSRIVGDAPADRLKYAWFVRFTTVGLSVVAV